MACLFVFSTLLENTIESLAPQSVVNYMHRSLMLSWVGRVRHLGFSSDVNKMSPSPPTMRGKQLTFFVLFSVYAANEASELTSSEQKQ